METQPLSAQNKVNSWALVLVSVCGGIILAVLTQAAPTTSLQLPATTTRVHVAPAVVLENQPRVARLPTTTALAAAHNPEILAANEGYSSTASPSAIGLVAAASTIFGAVAMKLWGQRDQLSSSIPSDLEANSAGAAPMPFRTAAPWSSSMLNVPDFSHETRGSRMVLQAAKGGKGKGGGGAKGKVAGIIKLALPAGKATPAPPVGPALGQYGLNIVAFCKEYNAATEKEAAENMIIPVEITAFEDRSYTFVLKTPPASVLLKKFAGVPSGSASPKAVKVGSVTKAQLEEIAKIKLPDLNTSNVEKAMKIVEGTAKQMGITIQA